MLTFKEMVRYRNIFTAIKWTYQRATRGWADCDWWNAEQYFAEIISAMIHEFNVKKISYPGEDRGASFEEWTKILAEIEKGFIDYTLMDAEDVWKGGYNKALVAERYKSFKNALKLFSKWYGHFWD